VYVLLELGGGYLSTEENSGSSPPPLAGSVLIVNFPSIEDVRKRIERDPYWTGNVVSPSLFSYVFVFVLGPVAKEGRKEGKADVERLKVVWFVGLGGQWDKEKMVIRPILLFDGPSFKG